MKPRVKAKTLRWKTIPQHAVENTIWSAASAQESAQAAAILGIVDKCQLEQLFTETETETAAKKKKKAQNLGGNAMGKTASVLDNSRARNIEILLRAVKVEPQAIAKAIGGLDLDSGGGGSGGQGSSGLDYDSLAALRKQWPTPEERAAVQSKLDAAERSRKAAEKKKTTQDAANGVAADTPVSLAELIVNTTDQPTGSTTIDEAKASKEKEEKAKAAAGKKAELTIAEQFVYCLAACPQVPRLSAKLSLGIFKAEFPSKASRVDGWIATVVDACTQVRGSSRFGTLLQVVLALGNTLNALGTGTASAAGGFRLSSLTILANTKSFDDSTSLLKILVARLEEKQPELLEVSADMPDIAAASGLNLKEVLSEVQQLAAGMESVQRELGAVEQEVAAARRAPLSAEDLRKLAEEKQQQQDPQPVSTDGSDKENAEQSAETAAEKAGQSARATESTGDKPVVEREGGDWGDLDGLDVALAKRCRDKLQTFRAEVSTAVERQRRAVSEMQSAFASLLTLYGEDPGTKTITPFHQFLIH